MVKQANAVRAAREFNQSSGDHRKAIVQPDGEMFGAEIRIRGSTRYHTTEVAHMAIELNACIGSMDNGDILLY